MAQPARRREYEPSSKRRKSRIEARRPLPTEHEDRHQMAITSHHAAFSVGPAKPSSAKLTATEEAMVVEFRQRTMMPPLGDMLGHLLDYFP